MILTSLRGDVCAWERDWVAHGGPHLCPWGLVPQLLEVAARADAELLWALWERPFLRADRVCLRLVVRLRWFPYGRRSALLLGQCARPICWACVRGGQVAAAYVP